MKLSVTPGFTETEFNDSTATADVVPLATTITGSALIEDGYDDDFYAFDVTQRGRANLSFTFPVGLGAGTMYEVGIYNESGTLMQDFGVEVLHATRLQARVVSDADEREKPRSLFCAVVATSASLPR